MRKSTTHARCPKQSRNDQTNFQFNIMLELELAIGWIGSSCIGSIVGWVKIKSDQN